MTQLREAYRKAEPYLLIVQRSKVETRNEMVEILRGVSKTTQDPEVNRTVDALIDALDRQK